MGVFLLAVQHHSIGVILTPIKRISEVWFGCYLDFPPVGLSTKNEKSSVHIYRCVSGVIFYKGEVGVFLLAVEHHSIGVIVTPIKHISEVWFGCYLDFPPIGLSTKMKNPVFIYIEV